MRPPPGPSTRTRLAGIALVAVIAGFYLAQILSPLRLNTDAYRFLSMAFSVVEGHGFLVDGKPDVYPEGCPLLLGGLIRLGLGSTLWINACNILCVLASALLFHRLLWLDPAMTPGARLLLAVLPLASWVCVKHATIPLSENPYLALSYAALLALSFAGRAEGWKACGWFALALVAALAAFRVRTIGLSLVVTTVASAFLHPEVRAALAGHLPRSQGGRISAVAAALLLLGAGALFIWQHQTAKAAQSAAPAYLLQQKDGAARGVAALLLFTLNVHTRELGEIFLNLPQSRIPTFPLVFLAAGGFVLVLGVAGLTRLARRFPPLAIYAVLYTGIILIWPFYDPRFWLPLIPVLGLGGWLVAERWWERPAVRWTVQGYAGGFLALGLAALVFSTRISLAGSRFPWRYGDGTTRDSYLVAFDLAAPADAPAADERWVRLLRRLEPRAQRAGAPR